MQTKYSTFFLSGFLALIFLNTTLQAQKAEYRVACIGFYNMENLFDTIDDPEVNDEEFLPKGKKKYTPEVYTDKLARLSRVVSELGTEMTPDGVAILGVGEIENRKVLEDLISQPALKKRNYQIVHEDCKYFRGVDVGLLYNPKYFKEISHFTTEVSFPSDRDPNKTYYSRDILWVKGVLGGTDTIHICVNHWPSRRGGEKKSSSKREHCAKLAKVVIDSLLADDPNAKILLTGDLNDDPISPSVKNILMAKRKKKQVKKRGLYNPMWNKYKKGNGTLTWNDSWNLFDQIIISAPFLKQNQDGYFFKEAKIYRESYLFNKDGRWKNSPKRSYSFNNYNYGYSDHLPVYAFFLQKVKK